MRIYIYKCVCIYIYNIYIIVGQFLIVVSSPIYHMITLMLYISTCWFVPALLVKFLLVCGCGAFSPPLQLPFKNYLHQAMKTLVLTLLLSRTMETTTTTLLYVVCFRTSSRKREPWSKYSPTYPFLKKCIKKNTIWVTKAVKTFLVSFVWLAHLCIYFIF